MTNIDLSELNKKTLFRVEIVRCSVCKEIFLRKTKPRVIRNTRYVMRPCNCDTCSKECSKKKRYN